MHLNPTVFQMNGSMLKMRSVVDGYDSKGTMIENLKITNDLDRYLSWHWSFSKISAYLKTVRNTISRQFSKYIVSMNMQWSSWIIMFHRSASDHIFQRWLYVINFLKKFNKLWSFFNFRTRKSIGSIRLPRQQSMFRISDRYWSTITTGSIFYQKWKKKCWKNIDMLAL